MYYDKKKIDLQREKKLLRQKINFIMIQNRIITIKIDLL